MKTLVGLKRAGFCGNSKITNSADFVKGISLAANLRAVGNSHKLAKANFTIEGKYRVASPPDSRKQLDSGTRDHMGA